MSAELTNHMLTQIAFKRLSGKAMTSGKLSLPGETIGSTVQSSATTIFGEAVPNAPISSSTTIWKIQSSSVGSPGTVQLAEFNLVRITGTNYANSSGVDIGAVDLTGGGSQAVDTIAPRKGFGAALGISTSTNTYHAYSIAQHAAYQYNTTAAGFNTLASTPKSVGTAPFINNFMSTGSVQFQIVPEFLSTVTGTSNAYIPTVINSSGTVMSATDDIDFYFDAMAGILFVQDPSVDNTGDGLSPPTNVSQPSKIQAFLYTGKYQSEVSQTSAGSFNISSSYHTNNFNVSFGETASFVDGGAGITVRTVAGNTLEIGKTTDNVIFANITSSNLLITNTASITYLHSTYESSSIIYQSGSTKFGDTNDDTHQFTGSVSILHTGSGYGFQLSGSSFLIENGNLGKVTLGEYNVGTEWNSVLPITGAGLIISQSFTNEATHHNMVKIGETELVDISGSVLSDSFLMNIRKKALIISSSDLNLPIAHIAPGDTKFWGMDASAPLIKISTNDTTIGDPAYNANVEGDSVSIRTGNATFTLGVGNNKSHNNGYTASNAVMIGNNHSNMVGGQGGTPQSSIQVDNIYPIFYGAITASAVSSSGNLFASLSFDGPASHVTDGVVVFDSASGRLFYTGSYGAGGGGGEATVTLHMSASAGTGFSFANNTTSSFTTGSGTGLTVTAGTAGTTNDIKFQLVGVFSGSTDAISGSFLGITGSLFTTMSSNGQGQVTASSLYSLSSSVDIGLLPTSNVVFAGLNAGSTNTGTITIGNHASSTVAIGHSTNTVTFNGSASIAGDLTVLGETTSIRTKNLNVEDQFILLASGSTGLTDGGIIIQTGSSGNGTALFFDGQKNRWALTGVGETAWNATTADPKQYVVSVSSSAGTPLSTPSNFGNDNTSRLGMMYVDTNDTDGDGNTIWIYAT